MSSPRPHHRHTWIGSDRRLARFVAQPLARFLAIEASGGLLLLAAATAALVWANSPWQTSYTTFWGTEIGFSAGPVHLELTLQEWVNDGLMAVFFFVAGLEIKREVVEGELRQPRAAALPIVAALGGMVLPALLYLAITAGTEGARGWGIPVATDIAFALGVVSLFGARVPASLKTFLLTLAIVDDLGGIVVIAVFYSAGVSFGWLAVAAALLVVMYLLRRARVWYLPVYLALGVVVWFATHESGIHATIAGVALGLLAPTRPLDPDIDREAVVEALENRDDLSAVDVRSAAFLLTETVPVVDRLLDVLHPWTSYLIVPLFALANAGVPLGADALSAAAGSRITWGVVIGLVVGKTVGVFAASWLVTRVGLARLPLGVHWGQVLGAAAAAGIGFTVSLFVAALAFSSSRAFEDQAKVGILVASAAAALVSAAVFAVTGRRASDAPTASPEPVD